MLKLFNLLNPCFIYWNNNIAISWRKEAELVRIVLIDIKLFSALNQTASHHRHSRHSKSFSFMIKHHIAMLKHFNFYNDSLPHVEMNGEDPRLITINNSNSSEGKETLWVVFCQRYHRANPELWMSYAEVIGLFS